MLEKTFEYLNGFYSKSPKLDCSHFEGTWTGISIHQKAHQPHSHSFAHFQPTSTIGIAVSLALLLTRQPFTTDPFPYHAQKKQHQNLSHQSRISITFLWWAFIGMDPLDLSKAVKSTHSKPKYAASPSYLKFSSQNESLFRKSYNQLLLLLPRSNEISAFKFGDLFVSMERSKCRISLLTLDHIPKKWYGCTLIELEIVKTC